MGNEGKKERKKVSELCCEKRGEHDCGRSFSTTRGPGCRAQRTQRSCRVKGTGANFHIVGLQHRAPFAGPIALKPQENLLERARSAIGLGHIDIPIGAANALPFLCKPPVRVNATCYMNHHMRAKMQEYRTFGRNRPY